MAATARATSPPVLGDFRRGLGVRSAVRHGQGVFVGLLVVGLVLRLVLMRTAWSSIDADEATGILMGIRGSMGHLSLVFWGGDYGGTPVVWIESAFFYVTGFHLVTVEFVDIVLALSSAMALWSVARRLLPPVSAGVVGGIFSFFPPPWLEWSSREYVFWVPAILAALLCARSVLQWSARHRTRDAAIAGLFGGLAIWIYPLVACLVVPPLALFLWAARRDLRALVVSGAAVVVGVGPWIAYLVTRGGSAFLPQVDPQSPVVALKEAVGTVLPGAYLTAIGAAGPSVGLSQGLLATAGIVLLVAALGGAVAFACRRRLDLAACSVAVLLWLPTLVAARVFVDASSFRYGLVTVPPVLILGGHIASRLRASLLLGAVAGVTAVAVAASATAGFAPGGVCPAPLRTVAQDLERAGRTKVWAAYWVAADLAVCAWPRVTAASTQNTRDWHGRQEVVNARGPSTYVVLAGQALDHEIATAAAHGLVAQHRTVGPYSLWFLSQREEPWQLGLAGVT